MGYPVVFFIGGDGVCTFFKLMGSGGYHNCFRGWGVCKKSASGPPPD